MEWMLIRLLALAIPLFFQGAVPVNADTPLPSTINKDGSLAKPKYTLPLSQYLSQVDRHRLAIDQLQRKHPGELEAEMQIAYPVIVKSKEIAGVSAIMVVPRDGVSVVRENQILINFSGGGFRGASGIVEAAPIASVLRIRVLNVQYISSTNDRFPAASRRVEALVPGVLSS